MLRVLLITILVLYIIRQLAKILLPMFFQSVVNKAQEQARGQQNYQQYKRPEGKVQIDHIPEGVNKGKVPDNEGEFVDYEEIK